MTKVQLISNWKQFYKFYSFWVSVVIAVLPDLVNLAIEHGVITSDQIPGWFSYSMKVMTFIWLAARLIKQKSLEMPQPTQES